MKSKCFKLLVVGGIILTVVTSITLAFVFTNPLPTGMFQKNRTSIKNEFSGGKTGGAGASGYWEDFSIPDLSLIPEREFIELDSGEFILVEKEYFLKFSGFTVNTWVWTDENGEFHQERIKYYIEWESAGVNTPIKLMEPEFHPTSQDEICPPPSENAILIKHEFDGWINDGVLWFRKKPIANLKELPLEKPKQYIFYNKVTKGIE